MLCRTTEKGDLQKAAEIKITEKYELKTRKQNPGYYKGDFSEPPHT